MNNKTESGKQAVEAVPPSDEASSKISTSSEDAEFVRVAKRFLSAGRGAGSRVVKEIALVARATAGHLGSVFALVRGSVRKKKLAGEVHDERRDLGRWLYDQGTGDEKILTAISNVEDRIESIKVAKGATKTLEQERDGLLIRLTESAGVATNSEDSEARFAALAESEAKIVEEGRGVETCTRALVPRGRADRLRVVSGYAVLLVAAVVSFQFVFGRGPEIVKGVDDEKAISSALGWVVCGKEGTKRDGSYVEIPISSGSCFAVHPDGYLVTNKHVIRGHMKLQRLEKIDGVLPARNGDRLHARVWVFFGQDAKYEAEVIHSSDDHDLAILKIDAKRMPIFHLSGERTPSRGSEVYACGFPRASRDVNLTDEERLEEVHRSFQDGLVENKFRERDFSYITTTGSVSVVTVTSTGSGWVQHDADIHGGNSGGPLLDENGVVIGINTIKHRNASGLSFALDVRQLREELGGQIKGLRWR